MIIRHKTQGTLAEVVTELDAHYIGFDPASPALRSQGMAPLIVFTKEQWESAITVNAPKLLTGESGRKHRT